MDYIDSTSISPQTLQRNKSTSSQLSDGKPRRQRSLVRPERERNDRNSRLYYYRQRATQDTPSDPTRNQPVKTIPQDPTFRRSTAREQFLRRGKSILGREEKDVIENTTNQKTNWFSGFDPWMTYCRLITFCIPGPILRCAGIPNGPAQLAWREKIGLVSFILFIMGCVGFLTFGFTQTVCPVPPLSVHGGQVSPGYLIINGWAYMLAEWEHPVGPTDETTNILYPPINAGGMDASFLFQTLHPECDSVFIPLQQDQPIYFPCQLFNPNKTEAPLSSQFMNRTGCHFSTDARNLYDRFQIQGIPKKTGGFDKAARVFYDWEDVKSGDSLAVYNGDILNLKLLLSLPSTYFGTRPGGLIESILSNIDNYVGKDLTMTINANRAKSNSWEEEAKCMSATIKVGSMDTISLGCMASNIVLYVSLIVILGVIIVKFGLAIIFGWFLSWRLGNFKEGSSYTARMEREAEIENWTENMQATAPLPKLRVQSTMQGNSKRKSVFPQTSRFSRPLHGSTRFNHEKNAPSLSLWPTPNSALESHISRQNNLEGIDTSRVSLFNAPPRLMKTEGHYRQASGFSSDLTNSTDTSSTGPICPLLLSEYALRQPSSSYMPFNFPLAHTICLVTCYSEGEAGIRITLDSIATSDYPNSHKLLLVICDGLITGSGETQSTPDICVDMMRDLIVPKDQVQPFSYVALADGSRQNNMAKVYAGFYKYDNSTVALEYQQRVPMVTIVKCGTEQEREKGHKPGNRGKRDSQIILMQFMQKVMFDERMTRMEYEFFNRIWQVTGVPPDAYEIVLMVDADTKLFPDALSRLISCAVKDPEISGLCGETKIANKTSSWVTMIQVFEYYISHHQSKAFESIFGGVTCLPGCFCMYRIKAPKGPDGYWVPILANPDIVERYSENVVDTLHKKNLLLLGEDRYLSTLMLRTFPNRKMMFVPQAVCKTVVPETFLVLLSQRRRWINSTIHNLMELLFVHDLCGTFCFSMQFVIFMELVGTLALPAAISFTVYLVVMAILGQPALIPLILLALILGLPAVLIVMTSRKVVYVGWMLIYLISLPIWNFVLPSYAYWHFDDFSWGDTRKVAGAEADRKANHGDKEGEFDSSIIVMKKWSEYEKQRRVNEAIDRNLPIPRFANNKKKTVDVFRDSAIPVKKLGSAGSSDSDVPLTQMGYLPAGSGRNNGMEQCSNYREKPRFVQGSLCSSAEIDIPLFSLKNDPTQKSHYLPSRAEHEIGLNTSMVNQDNQDIRQFPLNSPSRSNYLQGSSIWSDPASRHHQQVLEWSDNQKPIPPLHRNS